MCGITNTSQTSNGIRKSLGRRLNHWPTRSSSTARARAGSGKWRVVLAHYAAVNRSAEKRPYLQSQVRAVLRFPPRASGGPLQAEFRVRGPRTSARKSVWRGSWASRDLGLPEFLEAQMDLEAHIGGPNPFSGGPVGFLEAHGPLHPLQRPKSLSRHGGKRRANLWRPPLEGGLEAEGACVEESVARP